MRTRLAISGLMLLAAPQQAYAQIWEGQCNTAPATLYDDINAAVFGTWAAHISVEEAGAACRYRGESVWTLYEYDAARNGKVRGERRMTVQRSRPSGCQRPIRNPTEVDVTYEQRGEGRCAVRAVVISRYDAGPEVRAEISRITPDALTVTTGDGRSVIYRRRPRIRSSRVEDYPNELNWRRSCGEEGDPIHYLAVAPAIHRQGSVLSLRPMLQQRGPVGAHRLPIACVSGWTLSHPDLARLDEVAGTLAIAADTPPGSEISVSYRAGERPVSARIRVLAANAVVLTGRRSQRGVEGCREPGEPVGELVFGEDGRFSVTFQPFESYSDYWGRYRFDPATGALTLTVEGGNYRPPFLDLEGTARIEDETLVLDGFYLGSRNGFMPPPGMEREMSCRYRF